MSFTTSVLLVAGQPPDPVLLGTVHAVLGGKAVHAATGDEALWWAQQEDFVAILIEAAQTRARSGFELARMLRRQDRARHTPILFLTDAPRDVMGLCLGQDVGLVDFLAKPVEADLLRAKVAAFSELFRAREELKHQAVRLREEESARRQSLAEERQRFFALVENSPDFICIADVAGVPVYVNPAGRRIVGLGREDDVGRTTLLDYYAPEAQTQAQETIIPGMVRDGRWEGESRFRNFKTGASIPVSDTHFSIQDPSTGRVIGYGTITRDISEQRQGEKDRERILKELGEAVRLRDEFLSVASHELKTPLTPLNLKLQALESAARADAEAPLARRLMKDVDMMRRQVRRLADLVNDLLDVSRISTGRMKLTYEPLDLPQLVQEVVARFDSEAERAGCRIEFTAESAIPGEWDRLRLEQVLTNLLSNALKYGAGKPVHVQVRSGVTRAWVLVRDEGIGIAADAIERIFQKFERAVPTHHYGGLGLGLYVTQQIVDAMGGEVRVVSTQGQGATFTVELPRHPGREQMGGT
ncbi:sensor histidine kinase [Hyalangium versicolor]|uniref:sensor histidine kinase n=1 Tax=Hyalangium versicolor TaxID=2861190 RepID=UPI001CC91159|nr:ATP-binding protein [Hyalangium versicolor]